VRFNKGDVVVNVARPQVLVEIIEVMEEDFHGFPKYKIKILSVEGKPANMDYEGHWHPATLIDQTFRHRTDTEKVLYGKLSQER
jgi:hypothetical protein